ncbi:hypothetical protein TIFTF001_024728 [Ficus carica]|uniref:Uncharacterized protein n=1 Tax=Ficus carica TaxID=3494 RepID=A0AA88AMY0_FICCA|nr:hypothetical protein TIFTF001_024728 [Ficus carica]
MRKIKIQWHVCDCNGASRWKSRLSSETGIVVSFRTSVGLGFETGGRVSGWGLGSSLGAGSGLGFNIEVGFATPQAGTSSFDMVETCSLYLFLIVIHLGPTLPLPNNASTVEAAVGPTERQWESNPHRRTYGEAMGIEPV